jgi:hypothetical protein
MNKNCTKSNLRNAIKEVNERDRPYLAFFSVVASITNLSTL